MFLGRLRGTSSWVTLAARSPQMCRGQDAGKSKHLLATVQRQGTTCDAAQSPSSSKSTALGLRDLAEKMLRLQETPQGSHRGLSLPDRPGS